MNVRKQIFKVKKAHKVQRFVSYKVDLCPYQQNENKKANILKVEKGNTAINCHRCLFMNTQNRKHTKKKNTQDVNTVRILQVDSLDEILSLTSPNKVKI